MIRLQNEFNHSVKSLIKAGVIKRFSGEITRGSQIFVFVKADVSPREIFKGFVQIADILSQKLLTFVVDDNYSRIFKNRTRQEQELVNKEFTIFSQKQNCNVLFSSQIVKEYDPGTLFSLSKKITFNNFLSSLPKEKRDGLISLKEVMHELMQVYIINYLSDRFDTILFGQSSEAFFSLYFQAGFERKNILVTEKNFYKRLKIK